MASGLVAINFLNLGTKEGMQKMDKLLGRQNFISGVEPCKDDLAVYGALKGGIDENYVNIIRWYNQVNDILGSQFSREGEGVTIRRTVNPSIEHSTEETYINIAMPPSSSNEEDNSDLNLLHEEIGEENILALSSWDAFRKLAIQDHLMKKSLVKLHITSWDDDNSLKEVEKHVRGVQMNGLIWGDSQFVVVECGIKKLEIMMTIEDDKVSPRKLIGNILGEEPTGNLVQSCDIISFNKV